MAKYIEAEAAKKVKVGDEVVIAGVTGIVTRVPEGAEKDNAYADIHKTGHHFPQIAELLKQMKEED